MEQTQIDGQVLSYITLGKGTPVLFLHGFCETHSVWGEFLQPITEEGYQFILPDLPGFGESPLAGPTDLARMGALLHLFMTELGHDSYHLVGHSMGGYVALALLEQHPLAAKSLVMFHSQPFADSEEKKEARNKGIEFVERNGHELYVKQLFGQLFAPLFLSSNRYLHDRLVFMASNLDPKGIINALEAMRDRPDRSNVLRNATYPVQFIIGEEEQVIPPKASMDQTHLPQTASIDLLPKVNHMGMFSADKKCRRILLNFWEFSSTQEG